MMDLSTLLDFVKTIPSLCKKKVGKKTITTLIFLIITVLVKLYAETLYKSLSHWSTTEMVVLGCVTGIALMLFIAKPIIYFIEKRWLSLLLITGVGLILFLILKLITFINRSVKEMGQFGEYVWYFVFTIPMVFSIGFLCYAIAKRISANSGQQTITPRTNGQSRGFFDQPWNPLRRNFWMENELVVLIAFPLFHFLVYMIMPKVWENRINTKEAFYVQMVLIIFLLMKQRGEEKIHNSLGTYGSWLAGIALVISIFFPGFGDKVWNTLTAPPESPKIVKIAKAPWGTQEPFVFDHRAPMPACADQRVWEAAYNTFDNVNPMLLAFTARESRFRMYKIKNDKHCTPLDGKLLHAILDDGTEGTAVGALQIKPEFHEEFCKKKGVDMREIEGHFKCALLINDDPSRGPEQWDPYDGKPLKFSFSANPGKKFSKPWKLSQNASYTVTWDGPVEISYGLENGQSVIIRNDITGIVRDQDGNIRNSHLGIAQTIAYRSLTDSEVIGHMTVTYPNLSSKK